MSSTTNDVQKAGNIEEVLEVTGFGLYSICVMVVAIMTEFTKQATASILPFVIPYAACDFPIDSVLQGALSGVIHFGSAVFTPIWGTLFDIYGRKKMMLYMSFFGIIVTFIMSFSPDAITLLAMSLILGICTANQNAVPLAFLSEFHSQKLTPFMTVFCGYGQLIGNLFLPILAIGVIPMTFQYLIGTLYFNSWRLYIILALTVPMLVLFILFLLVQDTPKYFLSRGKNDKALEVLKSVYRWNKLKKIETFPFSELEHVKKIENEKINLNLTMWQSMKNNLKGFMLLFKKPYLNRLLVVIFIHLITGLNTSIAFWIPQYFAMESDYTQLYGSTESATICNVILTMQSRNTTGASNSCSDLNISIDRFIDSIIIGGISLAVAVITSILVRFIDKKYIIGLIEMTAGILLILSVYVTGTSMPLMLFNGVESIQASVILIAVVQTFPTKIRVFSISSTMSAVMITVGVTNLVLPSWLIYSCQQPFIIMGLLCIGLSILVFFFIDKLLPVDNDTNDEHMKDDTIETTREI